MCYTRTFCPILRMSYETISVVKASESMKRFNTLRSTLKVYIVFTFKSLHFLGNLYIASPSVSRAVGRFAHQLRFIDDFSQSSVSTGKRG